MSNVLDQPVVARQRRPRWPWFLAAGLALILVATATFVLGRSMAPSSRPAVQGSDTSRSLARNSELGTLRWETVGGTPVPLSAEHGPHTVTPTGVARGYTHDKAGAVLATLNISARMASTAPSSMYRATLRQQTYGDQDAMLRILRNQYSSTPVSRSRAEQYWYAISAGDPRGDLVQVSIIAVTPQTRSMGGYARLTRTLAWRDGDWMMQVPVSSPKLVTTPAGHTPIPKPPV